MRHAAGMQQDTFY